MVDYNEYRLPKSFAADDVIIDVGGHIGSFAAACHARGSRIIRCYEASSENAALARENVKPLSGIEVINMAILDRQERVEVAPFPGSAAGQNTGGSAVFLNISGSIQSIRMDDVLRDWSRVRLLKLDCEGSEWPILMFSSELWRVDEVCGEYHTLQKHELCPGEICTKDLLKKLLTKRFQKVKITVDTEHPTLGKFWASGPKPCPYGEKSGTRARSASQASATPINASAPGCRS